MADVTCLMKRYGLTKADCNKVISDKHLEEISRSFCSKWTRLIPYLKITNITKDDIDRQQGSEEEKRYKLFLSWKRQKASTATYRKLLAALLNTKCKQDAEDICKMLQTYKQNPSPSSSEEDNMYPTELKRENNRKELLQEIEELQTEIKNLKAQILSAEKENKSLEAKVFELQTRMFKLETENKEELISLKSELADLRIRDRERANHSWKEQSEMLSLKEKEHSKMLRLKEERHSDMLRHKEKKHSEILRLKEEQHSASFRMKENDNIVGYWQGESSWSKNHLAELQNQLAMAKVTRQCSTRSLTGHATRYKENLPTLEPAQPEGSDSDSDSEDGQNVASSSSSTSNTMKTNWCGYFYFYIAPSVVVAWFLLTMLIFVTLPNVNPSRGRVEIGNSDVVLVSDLDSSVINAIHFSQSSQAAFFYQSACSDIGIVEQYHSDFRSIRAIIDQSYKVDELYLIESSQVTYHFLAPDSEVLPCAAYVYVFKDYFNYNEFISFGRARNVHLSGCLSPNEVLTVTLSPVQTGYYFVALKSFDSTELNYTVISDVLSYDVTGLYPTTCSFSTSSLRCSLSINNNRDDQEVCLLASLLATDAFVSLSYVTVSYKYDIQLQSAIYIFFIPFVGVPLSLVIYVSYLCCPYHCTCEK